MDENLNDVAVDIDTEVEETTNSNENSNEDTVDLAEQLEKQRQANAQITARAKRAEEELKKFKTLNSQPQPQNDPQLSEELKLIARGLSDEEIEQAKVVAKGKGINLTEAIKDPLFVTYQENLKEQQRKENAKLGASKGSGESREESIVKSGMSREEHMKAFKKVMGN